MKKTIFAILLIVSGLSCKSQTKELTLSATTAAPQVQASASRDIIISGTVKAPTTNKIYFEEINERNISQRLDSVTLNKDYSFTYKGKITNPNIYQLVIGSQKIMLLLDGGENLTIDADGFDSPDKRGIAVVKGSKTMDYFNTLNGFGREMQAKAQSLQAEYETASAKKNKAKMEQIRQTFETQQTDVVKKVKAMIPEMGTSIVALYATNYLSPTNDFDDFIAVADRFKAAGLKYPVAQSFINNVNRNRGTSVGQAAPDFELKDLKGNTVKLSDLKGKIVILDFWATWCGPCIASFPAMQEIADKYKNNPNVKVLFMNTYERVSQDQWAANTANFINQRNMNNYDVVLDIGGNSATSFGVEGIPAKFCIGKDGKIKFKSTGFLNKEMVLNEVNQWISEASK